MVAELTENRLEELEVDGGHLGSENGIPFLSHFFREFDSRL